MKSADMMGRLRIQLLLGLGLGAMVMLGLTVFGNVHEVVAGIAQVSLSAVIIACSLSLANYTFRFLKWHYYLKTLELPVSVRTSYLTFMSGLSMSVTPGKLGEVLKAFMLKASCDIPVAITTPVVIAERATDAFGLLVLAAVGTLSLSNGRNILLAFAFISIVGIWLIRQRNIVRLVLEKLSSVPKLGSKVPILESFYESTYTLFTPFRLLITTFMSAASWALEGLAFYVILKGLGLQLPLADTIFIFAFSSLVGALSMLPGGLGAADGSLVGLLAKQGIQRGPASVAALLIRLCTLWLAVVVGLIFLMVSTKIGLAVTKETSTVER